MKNFKNSQQGGVLVFTLLIIITLMTLGISMLPLTTMENKTSHSFSDYQQAIFLAEAGIEEAIARLNKNWESVIDSDFIDLGNGQYKFLIEEGQENNIRIITSTGIIGNIQRTIEVEVQNAINTGVFNFTDLGDYALFSNGKLKIDHQNSIINVREAEQGESAKIAIPEGKLPNFIKPKQFQNMKILDSTSDESLDISTLKEWSENLESYQEKEFIIYEKGDGNSSYTILGSNSYIILEDYKEVTIEGPHETLTGVIILKNVENFNTGNKTTINGMIILINDRDSNFDIHGSEIMLNGSLISLNPLKFGGTGKVTLNLNYDRELLGDLTKNLNSVFNNNISSSILNINHWKEIGQ